LGAGAGVPWASAAAEQTAAERTKQMDIERCSMDVPFVRCDIQPRLRIGRKGPAPESSVLDAGEIDEFMIHVVPTFIGERIPLIAPDRRTVPLKLTACRKFTDGVVKLHYAVRN